MSIIQKQFPYETDIETILIAYIAGDYCYPPQSDLNLATTIAGNVETLNLAEDLENLESAMCWVATVGMGRRKVLRA